MYAASSTENTEENPARYTWPRQVNKINHLKKFILGPRTNFSILGQKFSYPMIKSSENFYPRTKILRIFPEIFCPIWGRTNFIWVGQSVSENIVFFCIRTKNIPWDKNFRIFNNPIGQFLVGQKFL